MVAVGVVATTATETKGNGSIHYAEEVSFSFLTVWKLYLFQPYSFNVMGYKKMGLV